jgi:hypothetical protein
VAPLLTVELTLSLASSPLLVPTGSQYPLRPAGAARHYAPARVADAPPTRSPGSAGAPSSLWTPTLVGIQLESAQSGPGDQPVGSDAHAAAGTAAAAGDLNSSIDLDAARAGVTGELLAEGLLVQTGSGARPCFYASAAAGSSYGVHRDHVILAAVPYGIRRSVCMHAAMVLCSSCCMKTRLCGSHSGLEMR